MRAYEHFQVNLLTANYKKTHHRRKWSFLASVGATSQGQSKKISPIAGDGNVTQCRGGIIVGRYLSKKISPIAGDGNSLQQRILSSNISLEVKKYPRSQGTETSLR